MNGFALAGLGNGISQGLREVTQGMIQAEDIKNNRIKLQQQAQKFEQDMQLGGLQINNEKQKQKELEIKLAELTKSLAKRDTFDALSAFEQTGDASVLNSVKNNKVMSDYLSSRGIAGFTNISDLSEEKIASLGITKDILDSPTTRVVLATMNDGRQVPMDMMKVYATSGFLPQLGEKKLQEITMRANEAKANLEVKSSEDALTWLQNNPGKTYQDYTNLPKMEQIKLQGAYDVQQQAIKGKYDVMQEEVKGKYDIMQEEVKSKYDVIKESAKGQDIKKQMELEGYNIESIINSDIDKFVNTIKTSDKTDTIDVGGKNLSIYAMAKAYEDNQKQQLDTNYKSELRGKRNVILGSDRVIEKLSKMQDWNISTKASSEIERVIGDFTNSLSDDKTSNTVKGSKTLSELKDITKDMPSQERIYMESYIFPVVADYIKAMSGAAVSEQERTAYVSNMTSGWMASKSAFEASITGFRESVNDSYTGMLDSIAPSYPKTFLDLKIKEEDKKPVDDHSTTKEWNGKVFKLINNQWVEQVGK